MLRGTINWSFKTLTHFFFQVLFRPAAQINKEKKGDYWKSDAEDFGGGGAHPFLSSLPVALLDEVMQITCFKIVTH